MMFDSKKTQMGKINIERANRYNIDKSVNDVQDYEEIDYSIDSITASVATGVGTLLQSIKEVENSSKVEDLLKNKLSNKLNSEAAIIYDATNGEVLFEKNGYDLLEPASMTKVITAHVVMKYGNIYDTIEYSKNAIDVDGKRKYDYGTSRKSPVAPVVKSGNKVSVKDALHISLLLSDNATTVALQEYIESITRRKFEDIMNEEIKKMGCEESKFTNSFGFEDPKHLVSPYEMAKIVAYINKNNKDVINIMGTKEYSFNHDGDTIKFEHSSSIIDQDGDYHNEDAIGCKTGFTDTAGQTMVTMYKKDNKEYVIVTMKGEETESKFVDTEMLYDNIDNLLTLKDNSIKPENYEIGLSVQN